MKIVSILFGFVILGMLGWLFIICTYPLAKKVGIFRKDKDEK